MRSQHGGKRGLVMGLNRKHRGMKGMTEVAVGEDLPVHSSRGPASNPGKNVRNKGTDMSLRVQNYLKKTFRFGF